jgi:hypothetical protein
MSNATRSNARNPEVPVRVAAIHTTEGESYTAEGLRDADWWVGSAHAIFGDGPDEDSTRLTDEDDEVTPLNGGVPYSRASWTLRSGNPWSVNAELIGFASWSRAKWLTRWRQLNRVALWLVDMHKRFNIPLQKITAKQYRAGAYGVIGHIDQTEAYPEDGGTHWDPGPNFPYDVVIAKAKSYLAAELEPNMTPEQAKQLDDLHHALVEPVINGVSLATAMRAVHRALTAKLPSQVDGSDYEGTIPRFVLGTHELVVENRQAIEQVLDLLTPDEPVTAAAKTTVKK